MEPLTANGAEGTDRFQVRPLYAFAEDGRKLGFIVDSAAFVELDEPGHALAELLSGAAQTSLLTLHGALDARFGRAAIVDTIESFRRLEVLLPAGLPVVGPEARLPIRPGIGSLVLHVAHDCNMRCGYCYAEFGRYGGEAGMMSPEQAVRYVDHLFDRSGDRKVLHLTMFGGEPLLNMPAVQRAIDRGRERAAVSGQELRIGLTTNATLLTEEIAQYLTANRVTVSVSLDGPADINDRLRTFAKGSASTYQAVVDAVGRTGLRCVARVTITRRSTDVARIVRSLVDVGFVEVGAAPVATGQEQFDLDADELAELLDGYRVLADQFVEWAKQDRLFPFTNIKSLLGQIHAGDTRGMPCGAALELVAGDMNGQLYACHRFVGDERMRIGTLVDGVNAARRFEFLQAHHLRKRPDCAGCWARTLCSGGCHHIAHVQTPPGTNVQLSAPFCGFLRGFYRLGLSTYAHMVEDAKGFLSRLVGEREPCSQPTGL